MAHTIRVAGSDIAFPCDEHSTILDAARAAGYELPYSCRSGVCHNCKGRVSAGSFDGQLIEDQQVLFCQVRPHSDLEIVPREITHIDPQARKSVAARVYRIMRPSDDVAVLELRFPAGTRIKFKAGQYLQLVLPDGARRSFSMANPPSQSDGALLHVRTLRGGTFSESVLPTLATGSTLQVELPFGDFFLREGGDKPMLFVASGTGFAPIKSMLEDAFRRGVKRDMALYWGARRRKDLYALELPQAWVGRHAHFRFVPVLSEADPGWDGRTGFVHRAVMEDFASLAMHQVYACGVTAMVNAARHDFLAHRGLPAEEFYCDAFVTPAEFP